jgi:hypothetical protein
MQTGKQRKVCRLQRKTGDKKRRVESLDELPADWICNNYKSIKAITAEDLIVSSVKYPREDELLRI